MKLSYNSPKPEYLKVAIICNHMMAKKLIDGGLYAYILVAFYKPRRPSYNLRVIDYNNLTDNIKDEYLKNTKYYILNDLKHEWS